MPQSISLSTSADKVHRGNMSQFYVAAELSRRGYMAVITMGNCPNTDILCSNKDGTKFIHIQVKTFRPGDTACSVGKKAERFYGDNFFWILSGIPEPDSEGTFQYYIVPSKEMAKNITASHKIYLNTPGQHGQQRSRESKFRKVILPPGKSLNGWSVSEYLNDWSLIATKLK